MDSPRRSHYFSGDKRQIDVARALGCLQTRVSKYELGTRRLDLLELQDVCKVLEVALLEFVRAFDKAVNSLEGNIPNRKRTEAPVFKEPKA
jgi:transcriptional regulator with XRE-family HTH domain